RKWGTSAATVVTTPAASYLQSENSSSGADGNISIQSEEFGSETESTTNLIVGTRYQLGIHIKRHTGVTPFACQVCDKHYPAQHELNSHMRTRHPQVEAFKRVPCTTYEKSVSTENVTKHVACIAHKKVVFTKSATEQRIDFFHSDENPAEPTISVNPLREHVGEKATERSVESVREPPSKRMCMDNEPEKYSVVVQNGKAGEMGLGGQGLLSEDQTDPLDDVNSTQAGGDSSQEMQEQENAGESDVEGAITNSEKKLAQGENAAATSKDAQMEKRLKRARRLTFSKKKLVFASADVMACHMLQCTSKVLRKCRILENAEDQEGAVTISEKKLAQCEKCSYDQQGCTDGKETGTGSSFDILKEKAGAEDRLGKQESTVCLSGLWQYFQQASPSTAPLANFSKRLIPL
ncbi:hypothetical protein BaRGS_00010884, partial [Batillaria attramentaria]